MKYGVWQMYPTDKLIKLFEIETGLLVDAVFVHRFRMWLRKQKNDIRHRGFDESHEWLVQKAGEFMRRHQALEL